MRRESKNAKVTSAILVGISAMMALQSPMTAMAAELEEKREGILGVTFEDASKDEYTNTDAEAQAVAESSQLVQEYNEAAEKEALAIKNEAGTKLDNAINAYNTVAANLGLAQYVQNSAGEWKLDESTATLSRGNFFIRESGKYRK